MDISREPTEAEIASFLGTRTGSQMVQLVNSLYEPFAQLEFAKAVVLAPVPVVEPSTTSEKAKKGLNGFVGFRCYYINCPAFKQYTMSKLSSVTGKMWKVDPNHSVWTLMTKAWSIIRDQVGKDSAPLDQFLSIACPFLNLPPPETYLELQGWSVTIGNGGELLIDRDSLAESSSISARCADMGYSVEDIISYCQSYGFALDFVHDKNTTSPTFLVHSHQHVPEDYSKINQAVQVVDSAHETRVLAKKQRRAKRQNLKNTGLAPALKKQIFDMHVHNDSEMPVEEDIEPALPQFYQQVGNILTNNTVNNVPSSMTNHYAAVNNMPGNMINHYASVSNMHGNMVNNMTGNMVNNMAGNMVNNLNGNTTNNYAAAPIFPIQNPTKAMAKDTEVEDEEVEIDDELEAEDEPQAEEEHSEPGDDRMDLDAIDAQFKDAIRAMTDYDAFRNSANQNATLPPFDKDIL